MVDEQDTVQMVHLVLNDRRQQTVSLDVARFVVAIDIAQADAGRTDDVRVLFGDRKTALFIGVVFVRDPQQLRIDQA